MNNGMKRKVRPRAGDACEYCGIPQKLSKMRHQMDHIVAEKHGGETQLFNLALACIHCNLHKGSNIAGIDPLTHKQVPLFHPRKQDWKDHFRWDGMRLVGLTTTGRTTIRVLEMNNETRLEIRRVYYDGGVFPWPTVSAR